MANRKISDLTALTTPATGDLLPIVDISEAAAADKNKKITFGELFASIPLGTAAAPSVAFEGDANTGIYSPGADQVAISTNGVARLTTSTTAVSSSLAIDHPLGAVGTPSITFTGDLNTGFYSPAADTLAAVTAGQNRLHITSGGLVGLGTSAPSAKLDVEAANFVGGPVIGVRFNTSNPRLGFNVANSNGFVYIGSNTNNKVSSDTPTYDLTGTAASQLRLDGGQIIFNNAPSGTAGNDISFTNRLTITSAGLVGIGITPSSLLHLADAGNITVGTTTGTKIGTATTQKLGFYNATPVVQPTAVADATTAVDVITQLNALLAKLRTLGIIAT